MKHTDFLRSSYRLIVRMHPGAFRKRFGDEMLWIFDADRSAGTTVRLFGDGVLSLLRQHAKAESGPEPVVAGFGLLDTRLRIAPRRFLEAGVAASLFLAGVLLLLGKTGKVFAGPACLPGVPRTAPPLLHAPSRIPRALPHSQIRVDARQIDGDAASAVRIIRAQASNSLIAGYCSQAVDR